MPRSKRIKKYIHVFVQISFTKVILILYLELPPDKRGDDRLILIEDIITLIDEI